MGREPVKPRGGENRKINCFPSNFWKNWPKPRFSSSPDLAASIGIEISDFQAIPTHFVPKVRFLQQFLKIFKGFRRFPRVSEGFQRFPTVSEGFRRFPKET